MFIHWYILKKAWWRYFSWISEMQKCVIFNFLGVLNAMSIFLCFFNSSKNKSNFNVCFSETVFLNSSSVFCLCTASVFFHMTVSSRCLEKGDVNSSLYFCFCAGNAMQHSPDSVKKVTVKVFGYVKTRAKWIKARGKEALKLTNTQGNKH